MAVPGGSEIQRRLRAPSDHNGYCGTKACTSGRTCVVEPAQGYGERDDALVFTVERSQFASGEKVEEGMQFEAHDENGARIVTVVGVDGEKVTIDANHPLAGAKLHFDVKVVEVREASPEELEHGHVHGGHDHGCGDDCDCEGGCDEGGCGCGH